MTFDYLLSYVHSSPAIITLLYFFTMRPENTLEQQSLTILEDVGLYLQDFVAGLDNLPSEVIHLLAELRKKEEQFQDVRRRIKKRDQDLSRHYKVYGYALKSPCSIGLKLTPEEQALLDTSNATSNDKDNSNSTTDTPSTVLVKNETTDKESTSEIDQKTVNTKDTPQTTSVKESDASEKSNQTSDQQLEKRRQLEKDMITHIRADFDRAHILASEKIEITKRTIELINRHIKHLDADIALILPEDEINSSASGLLNLRRQHRNRHSGNASNTNTIISSMTNRLGGHIAMTSGNTMNGRSMADSNGGDVFADGTNDNPGSSHTPLSPASK
ncbi:hypothetical protein BDF19DRAFT_437122 [Syncephalis fuscata]|nr:hypothetical protein BDF19DRAFT_437122 [Syncephalis fuscata]